MICVLNRPMPDEVFGVWTIVKDIQHWVFCVNHGKDTLNKINRMQFNLENTTT